MGKKKVLLTFALVCVLALVAIPIAGCTSTPVEPTEQTYTWKFGQVFTEGTIRYDQAVDLIDRIETAFGGRVTIEHFPGELLGDYAVQCDNTATGAQDMYWGAATESNSEKWVVQALPYVVFNWEQAQQFFGPGGNMHQVWEDISEESNWKMLAGSPEGLTGLVSKVELDPMPGPKGLKARVMAVESAKSMMEAVGFDAITMPWSEIHSALMLGTIDATWGPTGADDFLLFSDAAQYAYLYNFNFGYGCNDEP